MEAMNQNDMKQFMDGAQMMLQGWGQICMSLAKVMGGYPQMASAMGVPTAMSDVPVATPATPKPANAEEGKKATAVSQPAAPVTVANQSATPAEPAKATDKAYDANGNEITIDDIRRAMGAKFKALGANGGNPKEIGNLFSQFGATCVSDLKPEKYVAYLEALNNL